MIFLDDILRGAGDELLDLEISSHSRQYNRDLLFVKHYFYHLKKEVTVHSVGLSLEQMLVSEKQNSEEADSDSSSSEGNSESLFSEASDAEQKQDEDMEVDTPHRRMLSMWNDLDLEDQKIWRLRSHRLNAHPPLGSFCELPESFNEGGE